MMKIHISLFIFIAVGQISCYRLEKSSLQPKDTLSADAFHRVEHDTHPENFTRIPLKNITLFPPMKQEYLKDLSIEVKRRKRSEDSAYVPYSSSRKSSRYRYPLYRKRSNSIEAFEYDDQDWQPELDSYSLDSANQLKKKIISYLMSANQNKNQKQPTDQTRFRLFPSANVQNGFELSRSKRSRNDGQKSVKKGLQIKHWKTANQPSESHASSSLLSSIRRKKSVDKSHIRTHFERTLPLKAKESLQSEVKKVNNNNETKLINSTDDSEIIQFDGDNRQKRSGDPVIRMDQKRSGDSVIQMDPDFKNDILARKYFGALPQAYEEKKRNSEADFDVETLTGDDLERLISDPSDIRYFEELIAEAESNIANNVDEELSGQINGRSLSKHTDGVINDALLRLSVLEKMKESLMNLELKLIMDRVYIRAQNLASDTSYGYPLFEKRRKSPQFYQSTDSNLIKKSDLLPDPSTISSFRGNIKEECPVFERIVINCASLTKMTNDEDNLFLEPCIRHEMCYLCGGGMDVSRAQCDAILLSSLQIECINAYPDSDSVVRECLERGNESVKILQDPTRFDSKGSCTYDPCVRQLLESP